jgi:hypothetical protein
VFYLRNPFFTGFWKTLVTAMLPLACMVFLAPSAAFPQTQCSEIFQTAARVKIENQLIAANAFTDNRDLNTYSSQLPFKQAPSIISLLEQLQHGSTWIDMGAGEANALADGLRQNLKITHGIAVGVKKPKFAKDERDLPGRLRYLDGDFVENMVRDGKLNSFMGQVDLISDVFGPLSYSEHLPELFQAYFDLLKTNGTLVFNFMLERNQKLQPGLERRPESLLTRWKKLLGGQKYEYGVATVNQLWRSDQEGPANFLIWLESIPGIEVVEIAGSMAAEGHRWEKSLAIQIRKVSSKVSVPHTLRTVKYQAGGPPQRVLEVVGEN